LGDQTDAKVLLGTYVCTEVPGEFRWQAGALTQVPIPRTPPPIQPPHSFRAQFVHAWGAALQAVREGRWIVIEDIDLAPLEILSVLIPLLETRKLFIPGRGEVIYAPKNFQLFATQTLYGSSGGSVGQNGTTSNPFPPLRKPA
jgi:midasin